MEKLYLVLGATTGDPDVHGAHITKGAPEWQLSDGPPGKRGFSADFLSAEEALRFAECYHPGVPVVPCIEKDHE